MIKFPFAALNSMTIFITLDLNGNFRSETQADAFKTSGSKTFTSATGASFDANTKFYLCSGKDGISPIACTVSQFILEYRYYGDNSGTYAHVGGTNRSFFSDLFSIIF